MPQSGSQAELSLRHPTSPEAGHQPRLGKVVYSCLSSFLQEDLIDEIIITRVPILLGDGFPLFGKLDHSLKFRHKKTEIYNNILVKSYYTRDR